MALLATTLDGLFVLSVVATGVLLIPLLMMEIWEVWWFGRELLLLRFDWSL